MLISTSTQTDQCETYEISTQTNFLCDTSDALSSVGTWSLPEIGRDILHHDDVDRRDEDPGQSTLSLASPPTESSTVCPVLLPVQESHTKGSDCDVFENQPPVVKIELSEHSPEGATICSSSTIKQEHENNTVKLEMENDLLLNNQDDRNVDFASDAVRHTAHAHTAHAHSNENLTETVMNMAQLSGGTNMHFDFGTMTGMNEQPYLCPICGKSFGSSTTLTQHKRIHTGEKHFKCATCDKAFIKRSYLVRHERSHTGEKPYACTICGRRFSIIGNLTRHKRTHTSAADVQRAVGVQRAADVQRVVGVQRAADVQRAMSVQRAADVHQAVGLQQADPSAVWISDIDNRHSLGNTLDPHYHESAVSTISILPEDAVDMNLPIRDMSVTPITPQCAKKYSNAKSFTCFTCAKIFSKRSYLIRHERKHTGEKPYTCMTCGRSFSAIGNLTRHKRTHSESSKATTDGGNNQDFINFASVLEEPQFAEILPLPAASPVMSQVLPQGIVGTNLTTPDIKLFPGNPPPNNRCLNTQSHAGEKTFACATCDKGFSKRSYLIRHERKHTGEKPYACMTCGRCFSIIGNLTRHKRTHSG